MAVLRKIDENAPFSQALPGARHPSSGSLNVSMKSKGKNVVVSGIRDTAKGYLDKLMKHMTRLLKLRGKGHHAQACSRRRFPWPDVPRLLRLKEMLSSQANRSINLMDIALKKVSEILKEIGTVNVAIAAPLVVANTLETHRIEKSEKRWHLIKEMYHLAIGLKRSRETAEGMQDVMQEATLLIIEGALMCSTEVASFTETGPPRLILPGFVSLGDLRDTIKKLKAMSSEINVRITAIEPQGRSHLSKRNATHADNGQMEEDPPVPEPQVEEDPPVPEPQVEEDPPVPEPQVEEDRPSTVRQEVFKMEALVAATNNFDKDNKLGEGGFGAVYKGTTHHGKEIAVKKISFTDEERGECMKKQFENEKLLAEFQHRNLVNLLGSCEQESQGFLVYEYLPNNSVDKFLFDADKRKELDWKKRRNIIMGVARGLLYLHQDSRLRTVHRDIKASNILLDEELNPKIGDFGAAKHFPEDMTHVIATTIIGTPDYMAPEYRSTGKFSEKTDIFGFGLFLLELVTGEKKSSDAFLERVWSSYKRKTFVQMNDPTITEIRDKEKEEALRCIQVGLLCIQEDLLRPTMSEVMEMLSIPKSLRAPKKPPFQPSTARSWKMRTRPRKLYSFMRAVFRCRNRE